MIPITLLIGLLVAPLLVVLVYLDTTRRGLPQLSRLLWAGSVGVTSFIGFLLPTLFENFIHQIYFRGIKSNTVVSAPHEILALHISVGAVVALFIILLYIVGSRNTLGNDRSDIGTR